MKFKKISIVLGLMLALAVLLAGCATTGDQAAPAKPAVKKAKFKQFPSIVDAAFVKGVLDSKKGWVIDSRPYKKKYLKGHIPASTSLPYSQFTKMADAGLPKSKDVVVVFYCGGLKCPLSHKSAFKAQKLGYKNVKVYAAGYPDWVKKYGTSTYGPKASLKFKQYPKPVKISFVKEIVDGTKKGVIIDARPKRKKYDKGHIPGAINIPLSKFDKVAASILPKDKSTLLVFYCGGWKCPLSHKEAFKAEKMGYTNVTVAPTGYPSWKKAYGAGPTAKAAAAKSAAAAGGALKAGKEEGSVDVADLKKAMANNPKSLMLIDVRDASEFEDGSLTGAVNLPVDVLEVQIKTLPTDKAIVFICATGARSGEAYYMVKDMRPDIKSVYYIDGELTFAKDGSFTVTAPK